MTAATRVQQKTHATSLSKSESINKREPDRFLGSPSWSFVFLVFNVPSDGRLQKMLAYRASRRYDCSRGCPQNAAACCTFLHQSSRNQEPLLWSNPSLVFSARPSA